MFATQEQIEKAGRENMEAALTAAGAQLGALEKLASLNLQLTKTCFEAWTNNARALAAAKDAQELFKVQSSLLQPGTQTALDYWAGVCGVATQTYGEISRIAERRLAENGALARAKKAA